MLNSFSTGRPLPLHGIAGILFLLFSEILHLRKVEPFYSWFYCFAWWSYILTIDAFVYRTKANSLIMSRTREFFLMIPWSIFIWLIFEAANLSLKNWYYIDLPASAPERWLGYAVAYGTVLPGLFETTELLESLGLFKGARIKKGWISSERHAFLIFLGAVFLISSVLFPNYCFPLIWLGFIFLLEPINNRFEGRSLLRDLENGNPRKIYLLLMAGMICGVLWEFWNFWARSKWIYVVPFIKEMKGFEMPLPGFLGFPPFAVEAYVMYNFFSLIRYGRGWEQSTYRLNRRKRTRPLTSALTAMMIVGFAILIFRAIDAHTVDSYYARLRDVYWIPIHYRNELPRVGIATIEELVLKAENAKEKDELALRLLVPKEEFVRWVEKAQLAQLKGLGIENLRLLEAADIHSIPALAEQHPDKLYEKMEGVLGPSRAPWKAKIQIWIKEARKIVRSDEFGAGNSRFRVSSLMFRDLPLDIMRGNLLFS